MSPVVAPPPPARTLRIERMPVERPAPPRTWPESLAVFGIAYAVYAAIGLYATLVLHVVVGDAQSRLAHAYFVWWNEPSKLAAIGAQWPPLQTLALVPLAAIRPLATSLAALPLTSAAFGAAMLVVLNRTLSHAQVERALRWAILAAFGLNPLIAFYAANGMAEIVYLFLLTTAFHYLIRWTLEPRWPQLVLLGLAFGLAVLARYETAAWLLLALLAVVVRLVRQRRSTREVEASALAVIVPTVYALLLWTFLNWTITREPLSYLTVLFPHPPRVGLDDESLASIALETIRLHAFLFPFVPVLVVALAVLGLARRNFFALVLAASLLVNFATTFASVAEQREAFLLQLRYNLRALPLAIIALAWLLAVIGPRRRRLVGTVAVVALVASAPATAAMMLTYDQRLGRMAIGNEPRPAAGNAAFLRGLFTGADQNGAHGPAGTEVDVRDEREMARFIRRNVEGTNAVLADDAQAFGVMLADGSPERYLDRIDRGDARWRFVLNHPVGRVRYFLVVPGATRERELVFYDRIGEAYPSLRGAGPPPPFLTLVHRNESFVLYAVRSPR